MIGLGILLGIVYVILVIGTVWLLRGYQISFRLSMIFGLILPFVLIIVPWRFNRNSELRRPLWQYLLLTLAIIGFTFLYYPDFANYLGFMLSTHASGESASEGFRNPTRMPYWVAKDAILPWISRHWDKSLRPKPFI